MTSSLHLLVLSRAAASRMALGRKVEARTPLALGWEAAKANAVPAFILQAVMLGLLIGYYVSPPVAHALDILAQQRRDGGIWFVLGAGAIAGAVIPEIFLIVFFQNGKPRRE